MTYLWLDDMRKPPTHADSGVVWTWVKTTDEAIKLLQTGDVVFASLDHDLADEHYQEFHNAQMEGRAVDTSGCKEKTGYDVLCWMEEHGVWPSEGVRIHTMNTSRGPVMIGVVQRQYGRTFQYIY
jgi:hypothetical protein